MTNRRIDTRVLAHRIRLHAIEMTCRGKSSHVASVLSVADILAVLYGASMRFDPNQPRWNDRDRFILSKGHSGAGVYAVLAESGFFDVELLKQHYQNGSIFSGHVSHKGIPGVEISTGSLGHGLGIGVGMALAASRLDQDWKVFVVMSDGECDEGSNWEAAMFASHFNLEKLVAVVDYNKIQSLASVSETLALEPFADKWRAFGWNIIEIDGHDHNALLSAFESIPAKNGKPTCVIAHTIKGKGVSFMENSVLWHYRSPQGDEYAAAMMELEASNPEVNHA